MTVEPNFRKGMANLASFFHQNKHNNAVKPKASSVKTAIPPIKRMSSTKTESSSAGADLEEEPEAKRKKIVIKPRGGGGSHNEGSSSGNADVPGPQKASIQVFVKELKKKLEKGRLQDLVKEVRAYKDRDSIDNLLALLRTFKDEKLVNDDDLRRFQPFVRRVDEAAFTKLFYS